MNTAQIINKYGEPAYASLKRKYKISIFWFISLNLFSISLVSILILLNIFAIRWNVNPDYEKTKIWFVILTSLNGLAGFITTIMAFLKIKVKISKIETALIAIDNEKQDYSKNKGNYEKSKDRDAHFIQVILDILEKTEE